MLVVAVGVYQKRGVPRKIRQGRAQEEEKLSRTVEEDEVNKERETHRGGEGEGERKEKKS
jgi:hypothetical protein